MNGADPARADLTKSARLPYCLAVNKQTRDQYRRFMNDYPNRYDYAAARIDSPLSEEKMLEKAEKEKEKKRAQRKLKRQRETQQKQEKNAISVELEERQRFLALSDQEKRLLAIDRNFLNVVPLREEALPNSPPKFTNAIKLNCEQLKIISRCWQCGVDMSTHVPFEYFDYKFCSTKCLKTHRTQTQTNSQQTVNKSNK
jgi:response regulator RpfG family c-di-GMP phosphodiesterase